MKKSSRYIIGAVIGMCFEYTYKLESPLRYIPFVIGVLLVVLAVVDSRSKQL